MRVLEDLNNTKEHLWQNRAREVAALIDDLGQAERGPGLDIPVLLAQRLEQRPHQRDERGAAVAELPGARREGAAGVDARVPDDGVGVLEASDDAGDHLGHVRRQQGPVRPRQRADRLDALLAHRALLVRVGVDDAGEEGADHVRGQGVDGGLELAEADLVGVPVGDLVEGLDELVLELERRLALGRGGRAGLHPGGRSGAATSWRGSVSVAGAEGGGCLHLPMGVRAGGGRSGTTHGLIQRRRWRALRPSVRPSGRPARSPPARAACLGTSTSLRSAQRRRRETGRHHHHHYYYYQQQRGFEFELR